MELNLSKRNYKDMNNDADITKLYQHNLTVSPMQLTDHCNRRLQLREYSSNKEQTGET